MNTLVKNCFITHWNRIFSNISHNKTFFIFLESINSAAQVWGIKCLRYEIRKSRFFKAYYSFFSHNYPCTCMLYLTL